MIRTIFNTGENMHRYAQIAAQGNHSIAHTKQNIKLTQSHVIFI